MKQNLPILPEPMQMSTTKALKLNAWAGIAVIAAFASRLLLAESMDLTGTLRFCVALLPLFPGLLYIRALWRWMHELDELQQRLQLEAVCFATLGMLTIALVFDLLRIANVIPRMNFGWEGYFAFTFFLYALGLIRANRQYQ